MRRPTVVLRVFLPFAFGYLLSYLYRTVNAVIAPDLVRTFALTPDDLGLLTGTYFLSFSLLQLPLGVVLDRIGARRTEAALLVLAAAGAAVFALADSFATLVVGRALIGFGVSACLMAAFRAFVTWFPMERLPLINGCQMAAGGLGAIIATKPVDLALRLTDWRGVFLILAALTAAAIVLILVLVPRDPPRTDGETWRRSFAGTARVFGSALFWRVAPLTVACQATFLAIQSLWAGPWFADVAGLSRAAVADRLLLIAMAMVMGFLGIGWVADRLSRLGIPPMRTALAGLLVFMLSQALIITRPFDPQPAVWLVFGAFGTAGILPYAALSQRFPKVLAGRANTGLNLLVFVAAFAMQWGIGRIVRSWPPNADGAFPSAAYDTAFALMLALQLAGMAWYLAFRRERVPAA